MKTHLYPNTKCQVKATAWLKLGAVGGQVALVEAARELTSTVEEPCEARESTDLSCSQACICLDKRVTVSKEIPSSLTRSYAPYPFSALSHAMLSFYPSTMPPSMQ